MPTPKHVYIGHCHCGAIAVELRLSRPATEFRLRACQCGFCRPRGTRTLTDGAGSAHIQVRAPEVLERYRFGLKLADYLLCAHCGSYIGAVQEEPDGRMIAVINVAGLDVPEFRELPADLTSYDGESEAQRLTRRRSYWMPTMLVIGEDRA